MYRGLDEIEKSHYNHFHEIFTEFHFVQKYINVIHINNRNKSGALFQKITLVFYDGKRYISR
jgi:hypothetical protein